MALTKTFAWQTTEHGRGSNKALWRVEAVRAQGTGFMSGLAREFFVKITAPGIDLVADDLWATGDFSELWIYTKDDRGKWAIWQSRKLQVAVR